jgi:hypothetical protein
MARIFHEYVKIKDQYLSWLEWLRSVSPEERFRKIVEAVPNMKDYSRNMRRISELIPRFDLYVRSGGDPFIYTDNPFMTRGDFNEYHYLTNLML